MAIFTLRLNNPAASIRRVSQQTVGVVRVKIDFTAKESGTYFGN